MPKINYQPRDNWEKDILDKITLKNGRLRAAFPGKRKRTMEYGVAFYIWRNVVFYVSPINQHHCFPVGADFYLPMSYEERELYCKTVLDPFVDRIVNSIPKEEWYGVQRWGRIFGYIS
ncbi:MAG: hypothetical protein N3A54_01135 [Patescibacteria group bacterium]|nr:hypothetical protein [Patescibacteria group bacterium]